MISIDEMQDMLSRMMDELPDVFFRELNGGVNLLPDALCSPYARNDDYLVLGEYVSDGMMGRYINIYYGSFRQLFGHAAAGELEEELRRTLRHELRHHMEALAGDNALELEDLRALREYLERYEKD